MIMNNSGHSSPKTRPLPKFFIEQSTFSTKKEKETPKLIEINPPKPPIKSCPPISRLKTLRKPEKDGAKFISFLKNNPSTKLDTELNSKHYDENKIDLYLEQCFIIEGSLGCGSFGKVYRVKSKEDGKYYAIKKSREKFKGYSDRIRKLEEVAKHEELPPHPNCVKFFRAWEEKQRLYIQTELCQTSLSSYAQNNHNISEVVIWQIIVDLLLAVKHLHDRKLVHMDIKPDNIFISFDGHCKLGDFGLVVDLNKNDLREAQEGDPKYLAPEVLQNSNNITCAADIFSLGMTLLELATDLDLPRSGDAWHQLRNGKIPSHLISSLSTNLVDMIMKMIEPDYLKRSTVDELLKIQKVTTLIQRKTNPVSFNFYAYFTCFLNRLNKIICNIWYFIAFPLRKLKILNFQYKPELNASSKQKSIQNSDLENCQTSTPKKIESTQIDLLSNCNVDNQQLTNQNIFQNESFSSDNNSYNQANIDSLSSSLSDQSDIYGSLNKHHQNSIYMRKNKTEPLNKILSPCKTPPWKPMTQFFSYGADNTPVGPTRQKLIFDDNEDQELEKIKYPKNKMNALNKSPLMKFQSNKELSISPSRTSSNDQIFTKLFFQQG